MHTLPTAMTEIVAGVRAPVVIQYPEIQPFDDQDAAPYEPGEEAHATPNLNMPAKSVDALLEDIRLLSKDRYETVQAVRALLRKLIKPLVEEVKYGGILFSSDVQFGGVFAYKAHVSVEFGHGAAIADTHGHLEGSGRMRRHVKLTSLADIRDRRLSHYLPLALSAAKNAD